jgi:hypothetical protein
VTDCVVAPACVPARRPGQEAATIIKLMQSEPAARPRRRQGIDSESPAGLDGREPESGTQAHSGCGRLIRTSSYLVSITEMSDRRSPAGAADCRSPAGGTG